MNTPTLPNTTRGTRALPIILHPAFSQATPVITARELALAAQCAGLKEQVVQQQTRITGLEEQARNLTRALHRAACAG